MRLISTIAFCAFLFVGCGGEPTYVKPTGTAAKPMKNVTGDKSNGKTALDKID